MSSPSLRKFERLEELSPGTGGKDLFGLSQCIYIILREQSCSLLAELLVGWNNGGEAASSHDVSAGSPNLSGNGRADWTPPRLAWVGIEVEPGAWAGVAQPGWMPGRSTGLLVISSWIHTVGWERLELREWLNPNCLDISLSKAPASSPAFRPTYTFSLSWDSYTVFQELAHYFSQQFAPVAC